MLSNYGIQNREYVAMSPEIRRESRCLLSRPPRFNFSRLMAAIYPLPPRTPALCTDEGKKRQSNRHASMDLPLARSLGRLSFTLISFSLNKILVNLTLERKSLHEFTSDEQYHSTLG